MLNSITKKILALTLGAATFMPASAATYKVFASKLEESPESPVLSIVDSKTEIGVKPETSLEIAPEKTSVAKKVEETTEKTTKPIEKKVILPIATVPGISLSPISPTSPTVTPFPKADASNLNGKNSSSDKAVDSDKNETESLHNDVKKEDDENEIHDIDLDDDVEWKNENHDLENTNGSETEHNLEITK